jgi:hypothetical protein
LHAESSRDCPETNSLNFIGSLFTNAGFCGDSSPHGNSLTPNVPPEVC